MEPDLGLLQLGVRFYDPEVGRFTQRDSQATDVPSPYLYVGGSVLAAVDPTGLIPRPISPPWKDPNWCGRCHEKGIPKLCEQRALDVGYCWLNKSQEGPWQKKYGREWQIKAHFMAHCMAACLVTRCWSPLRGLGWCAALSLGNAMELFQAVDNFIEENIGQGNLWSNPNPSWGNASRINRIGADCGLGGGSCYDCCERAYAARRRGLPVKG